MKKFCQLIGFCILSCGLYAQTNNLSEEYYNFIKENKNIDYPASSALFPLQATYYQAKTDSEYLDSFAFIDSVKTKFNLSAGELEMLTKNGFVVTERLNYEKLLDALRSIYVKDLPVMITTDMMLYALHASYDAILKKLEIDLLRSNLVDILLGLRDSYDVLKIKYAAYSKLSDPLADVDLYISIPLALLGGTSATIDSANQETFDKIMFQIGQESFYEMPLFSKHLRKLDFSQFKTRGHYTEVFHTPYGEDSLAGYFKAMIWLGRMDFLLTPPPAFDEEPWSDEDICRMNASSLLLDELIDLSEMREKLEQNEKIISLMVGACDNLTPGELNSTRKSAGIENVSDILDSTKYSSFKQQLLSNPESGQKILSDIFIMDPYSPVPDTLPISFRLLGQRFIIDSYFFSQLVYDKIIYQDLKIWRPLPSPLDAMFILGNNDAMNLLQDEINTYKYASQLSSLRKLTDLYDSSFWQQSLYNSWLSCLRQLNTKPSWGGMPFFLTSAAWQHEKLNTQLASWAQLRHDNLLYAKPSYTGGKPICSYPYSYIEPYPEFYKGLSAFASQAGILFNQLPVDEEIKTYFLKMKSTCDTLSLILDKQINSRPLSERESAFLKNMYQYQNGELCGGIYEEGWFFELLFEPGEEAVVADVHTQPTDEWGNIVGNVLHIGTGRVNMGIFLANGPAPENIPMAFAGPVMSYYETITNDFYRYNDEEWKNIFPGLSRPGWTSIYLANNNGNIPEKGSELPFEIVQLKPDIYNLPQIENGILPYPNPAKNYLNIGNVSPLARLFLYDTYGRLVFQSINDRNFIDVNSLPTGIYVLKIVDQGKIETSRIIKE